VVGTSRTISSSKDLTPSPDLVLVDGGVSKKETAIKVVDAAVKHFGRIDLLVNNAGIYMPKAFTDYTEDDYSLVMNTNVASFFYMTQQVIPQMKKQNSGHVACISGACVDQPSRAATELLAVLSKSTMPAASKALALEYAANNIRFNTVSPAVVNTPMHAKGNHAELAKLHPLARMGEVSDVVDAVLSPRRHVRNGRKHPSGWRGPCWPVIMPIRGSFSQSFVRTFCFQSRVHSDPKNTTKQPRSNHYE
jgi:NAD(P)-dependent dehydrogenase (short-subunit alcohol dehydrogenase family)